MKSYIISLYSIGYFLLTGRSTKETCINASDKQVTQVRRLGNFSSVETNAPIKLVLKQGSSSSVTLSAADNIIPYIKTDIEDDKLEIELDENVCRRGDIIVTVSAKNYENITASGKVKVSTEGKLRLDKLSLDLSGDNSVDLNADVSRLQTKADGDSHVLLKGTIKSHSIKMSGKCTIDNSAI